MGLAAVDCWLCGIGVVLNARKADRRVDARGAHERSTRDTFDLWLDCTPFKETFGWNYSLSRSASLEL